MANSITASATINLLVQGRIQNIGIQGGVVISPLMQAIMSTTAISGTIQIVPSIGGVMHSSALSGRIEISLLHARTAEWPADWPIVGDISIWEMHAEQFVYAQGIDVILPALVFQGTGRDDPRGLLNVTLPSLTFSGQGEDSPQGVLNLTLPMIEFNAVGVVGVVGQINVTIPSLIVEFFSGTNESGIISVTLPALRFSAIGAAGETGVLAVTIPMLRWAATAHLSAEAILAVTIPMLKAIFTVAPQSYLNMVLNIKNLALTEYANYNFNSMCRFNGKNLGANSTKIFDLDSGEFDDGEPIEWSFRTGYLDLHQKIKKSLKQAWFSYKSNGDIIITVVQPNGEEYEYPLSGIDITEEGVRVKFGKGIRSKYVALDVRNVDGSTITLDTLKLMFDATKKDR